uniref:Guanine nucleotide-binding protein-like 3 n=1 Tax=Nothoprocta perdicaria TaxID=30464 RepID=A0A8C6YWT1_NOTPE
MKRPKLRKASKRREHHRKLRKEAKKRGRKKPRKDPGIPSAAPFKEELLREAEQRKQRLEELKQKQKLDRQKELEKRRKLDAKKNAAKIKENAEGKVCVIEASDVILEVLDARDPLGCRCPQLEQAVCSRRDKKLLLVLNKIDLVPKENLEKWLNYLKNEFPTVAFKSATLLKDRNMKVKKGSARIELSKNTECFGSECLLKLLREHCKTRNKAIQVGVVGFPNVGKSSIINGLKGARACNVGPARGVTKAMQIVPVDKQMKILDSPSIVADPSNSTLALALRSIIDTGESGLTNVVILFYSIPDFRTTEEFLTLLAQKRGMLKKGGLPDTENVARLLLCDWTGAKISYHSHPPEQQRLPPYLTEDKIAEMQKDFNLKKLEEENTTTVQALKYPNLASSIIFQSAEMTNGTIKESQVVEKASERMNLEGDGEDDDEEEEDEEENFTESDDDQHNMEEEESIEEVSQGFMKPPSTPRPSLLSASSCKLRPCKHWSHCKKVPSSSPK